MLLARRFYSRADQPVRVAGQNLFHEQRVRVDFQSDRGVVATISGSQQLGVVIHACSRHVHIRCVCESFMNTGMCAHIWATFLAADARGFLKGENSNLNLVPTSDLEPDSVVTTQTPKTDDAPPRWKQQLAALGAAAGRVDSNILPEKKQIGYLIKAIEPQDGSRLTINLGYRTRRAGGEWGKFRLYGYSDLRATEVKDPVDKKILGLISGVREARYYYVPSWSGQYTLESPLLEVLLPMICATGRCFLKYGKDQPEEQSLEWDGDRHWEFRVEIERDKRAGRYKLRGWLLSGDARMPVTAPSMIVRGGVAFCGKQVSPVEHGSAFEWVKYFRGNPVVSVPVGERAALLKELMELPSVPPIDLPEELRLEEVLGSPKPKVKILRPEEDVWPPSTDLRGELSFDYDGEELPFHSGKRGVVIDNERKLLLRDLPLEGQFSERLLLAGFRDMTHSRYEKSDRPYLLLNPKKLPRVVAALISEGWRVEAEGKLYRSPSNFRIEVTSGVDWFDLNATVEFDGVEMALPELLGALRRGLKTVLLGDGTFGVLPEKWLQQYGLLAAMGSAEDGRLRFSRGQVGLLDALLASQPEVSFDQAFATARSEFNTFQGIEAADAPSGFVGDLRAYQREGLGWLYFLQRFGFGGCLADCMGLGKTVMALALLESRRVLRSGNGRRPAESRTAAPDRGRDGTRGEGGCAPVHPSLLVAPRSLVFNWKLEAQRFTPDLRILDHTGLSRVKGSKHFEDYDLVITTYGTLRRDAADFNEARFDYVILDEAQAIKNATTESARAVRLLKGDNRLALSGTPIENHLGELWSLLDFLNPGLLGGASVFKFFADAARPDVKTRELLARAVRPFILRRTKEQVARDLPEKLEQTIYCEMEPEQQRLYDQLRQHYRASLLGLVDRDGIKGSKIRILEALLRLRQAACHPGLIDKKRLGDPCTKLDVLMMQLSELMDEGHKVLVFSQFTSFLAILRRMLDKQGVVYEYLDGKTHNRQSRVERFQNDADCLLFLISLKAGGLGLNLTGAEYVFLLDPWWNPAVEAQAVDRAHRIGQTRRVFAYRLITRDSVEEKVLELQQSKRNLADAIINADNSLIRDMSREDLALLFS